MSNKTYQKEYAERLAIAEKRTVPKITRYYFDEYKKGINNFVSNGRTDYISLFSYGVMQNIYSSMYEEIGMYFAKWYYNNYEKFLTKNKKKH